LAKKQTQLQFFKKGSDRYGGSLQTTRKGRAHGRPISTKHSMHFVLRSTKAKGQYSFTRHRRPIKAILTKFSQRFGVRILSFANVGNHLHLHIQLSSRATYRPFIRAITAAVMMKVTGISRWSRPKDNAHLRKGGTGVTVNTKQFENSPRVAEMGIGPGKFWDRRPFSRIVQSFRAQLNLRDYIAINRLEGFGYHRREATFFVQGTSLADTG
jgi:REP element-mobilizing transposase RayT